MFPGQDDPVASFLKRRQPAATGMPSQPDWIPDNPEEPETHHHPDDPAAPQPSTSEMLRGTMFTDPVRDFLLRRPEPPPSGFRRTFDAAVDRFFTPFKFATDAAGRLSKYLTPDVGSRSESEGVKDPITGNPLRAELRGFGAGAGEAAAQQVSPFGIVAAASPFIRGGGAVASLARAATAGGNAFGLGMSANQLKQAYDAGDREAMLRAGGQTALGALGVLGDLHHVGGQAPYEAPPPREIFENGNRRMPPLGPEHFPPEDVFEPNPNIPPTGRPTGLPELPAEAPPEAPGIRIRGLIGEGGQPLLPERAQPGPIITPPPEGSLPEVRRYGKDVEWQQPRGRDPVADFLNARPAAPAAPTGEAPAPSAPTVDEGLADQIAQKFGFRSANAMRQRPEMATLLDRTLQAANAPAPAPPVARPSQPSAPPAVAIPPAAPAEPAAAPPEPPAPKPAPGDPLARLLGVIEKGKADTGAGYFDNPHEDPLTQIANRRGWELAGRPTPERLFGRVDLDNFKALNDTMGHAAGDKALQVVADTLKGFARRKGDMAARLGGDEFGLNLEAPNAGGDVEVFRQKIEDAIAENLKKAGLGEAAGRQIAASLGFGPTEAEADAAAIARKKARGVSQPRGPEPPPEAAVVAPAPTDRPPLTPPPAAAAPPRELPPAEPVSTGDQAEDHFQGVLADARKWGYQGTDEQLRALYNDHLKSANDLIDTLRDVNAHENPAGRKLLQRIAQEGGIHVDPNNPMSGELAHLWESMDTGTRLTRNRKGEPITQRGSTAGAEGIGALMRRSGGLSLGELAARLVQDPQFREALGGSAHDIRNVQGDEQELHNLVVKALENVRAGNANLPTLDQALHASGLRRDRPWWNDTGDASFDEPSKDPLADILDTGEAQPRLPGDVGAVRDRELPQPREEAPFGLTPETSKAPDALQQLLAPEKPTAPELPEPRHDVRSPKKVTALAQSMREGGWQGRPVLVMKAGDATMAWTGTHRLAAAKEAGLTPADVPMHVVDGQKLIDAGYDLDELSKQGKQARIDALRKVGEDEAANLLEEERTAPPVETGGVRPNIKDFLVRQLGYSPEEVDALGPQKAMDLGNQVRMHPEGVQAGIAKFRKPAPPAEPSNPTPRPNLGEASTRVPADELATLLGIQSRRTALQRTRIPAGEVNQPQPTGLPERVQRAAVGQQPASAQKPAEKTPPPTQSEVARAKSKMTEDARTRAKLLENPTPENLDEYTRLMGEAADRQADREFRGGTGKEAKEGEEPIRRAPRSGEYLASGLGGLQRLYEEDPATFWRVMRMAGGGLLGALAGPKVDPNDPVASALFGGLAGAAAFGAAPQIWRTLAAKAPGVAKALRDTLPPSIGGAESTHATASLVRRPRDLSQDISPVEKLLFQPHHVVPDVWSRITPIFTDLGRSEDELAQTAASNGIPLTDRLLQWNRNQHVAEVRAEIQAAAKAAQQAGQPNRAEYLREMDNELAGVPTLFEKALSKVSGEYLTPKQARKILHGVESAVYGNLLTAALDTAIVNRSQMLFAYPQLGAKNIAEGMRYRRTPEGAKEIADNVILGRVPENTPIGKMTKKIPNQQVRSIVEGTLSPLTASDNANLKDAYASGLIAGRKLGLSRQNAHQFAQDITTQTQGARGELGSNPFIRHLGPFRMFTKFPTIAVQVAHDLLTHPDPGVRRRAIGLVAGLQIASGVIGISAMNLLVPRLPLGSAAAKAGLDLAQHGNAAIQDVTGAQIPLLGTADHRFMEHVDPRRGGTLLTGRYPLKFANEMSDFFKQGFGTHVQTAPGGAPRGSHEGWEGLASLAGIKSGPQDEHQAALNDAYDWLAARARNRKADARMTREDLARAIENGDRQAWAAAASNLTRAQALAFYRQRRGDQYRQLLEQAPREDRAEFERKFKGRLGAQ